MGMITLAGIDLEIYERGNGPPLLFLHGAACFRPDDPALGLLGQERCVIAL